MVKYYKICISDPDPKLIKNFYTFALGALRMMMEGHEQRLGINANYSLEKVQSTGMYRAVIVTPCPSDEAAMMLWKELDNLFTVYKTEIYKSQEEDS